MPSMNDVLASIPGYGAYIARRQMNEQSGMQDLQQAGALQGILASVQQQQAQLQDRSRQEAVRAKIAALKPEERTRENVLPILLENAGNMKDIAAALPATDKGQPIGSGGLRMSDGTVVPPAARPAVTTGQPIGSGGLRMPDGTIVPPAARPYAGKTEPLHPVIGPDGKPVLVPRSEAVGKTPYNASIAGAGEFSKEALRMTAEQYLSGDRQAIQGFARNATARIALQNEVANLAKEKGWKGPDIAAQMADFAGIMSGSRTVGTRAANIELASSEAEKMIDIVLDKSKGFDRTNFIPLNVALRAYETNTGKPEVKAFGASVNSLVNVYARAISPSGIPTVSDKEHAREMISTIDSPAQVQAVMDVMRQEMKAARAAPYDVRASTRRAITAASGAGAPATEPAAPAAPAALFAVNPKTKQRLTSTDGGATWKPVP